MAREKMRQEQPVRSCAFCDIIARRAPGLIRYEDDAVLVFDNLLHWVPVMLLVVPKQHLSQEELWENGVLATVGAVAIKMGQEFCPGGYRIVSNIGPDAMQSQEHGHVHVLGGTHLGFYSSLRRDLYPNIQA